MTTDPHNPSPAEPVPDTEKAGRVFTALALTDADGNYPRLTLPELAEKTGMSIAQTRIGWTLVRKYLGAHLAVMEPHRHNSVYYLSGEFDDGMKYVFWQAQGVYARIKSAQADLEALEKVCEHRPEFQTVIAESRANLAGGWSNLRQLIRTVGVELGVDSAKLNRILAD